MAGASPSRHVASELCLGDEGGFRTLPATICSEDCGTKGFDVETDIALGDSVPGTRVIDGIIIPSFSSDSSYGCCELPKLTSMKAAGTSDTADSGRAEGMKPSGGRKWPDFELLANEAELRLGEQVSDLLVCPEIEDMLEVHASSELATSARAHISKVFVCTLCCINCYFVQLL